MIKKHEEAIKFNSLFSKILIIFVIIVPLDFVCFLANTIIERREL